MRNMLGFFQRSYSFYSRMAVGTRGPKVVIQWFVVRGWSSRVILIVSGWQALAQAPLQ